MAEIEATSSTGNSENLFQRIKHLWPMLIGPGSMLVVCVAYYANIPRFYDKQIHETLAYVLLLTAGISFFVCYYRYRCRLGLWFLVLTFSLFCREWHFRGTSTGIKIALVVMAVWGYLWRNKVDVRNKLQGWILGTFTAYFLSQFTARRAFRSLGLPLEEPLHVPWEEVLETTAHIMLIVVSIIVWRCTTQARDAKIEQPPANS